VSEALLPAALQDRYRPQFLLGEGGFGRVVRAEDTQLGRLVAIKLLHRVDPEQAARMGREAKVAAMLRHPHALQLLDHGVLPDGTPYLVTPYLDGEDLHALASSRALTTEELRDWMRQVGEALGAAHEAGIVHRDVKPDNVMITESGEAVLCDFGLARSMEGSTFSTQEGLLLGTPEYMAPELWKAYPPSPASDQWAWAGMVHRLLGRGAPYAGRSPGEILDELARGYRAPAGCPPGLARALDAEPTARHPDMAAAVAAVTADLDGTSAPKRTVAIDRDAATVSGVRMAPSSAATRSMAVAASPRAPDRRPLALGLGLAACAVTGWLLTPGTPPAPPPPSSGPVAEDPSPRADLPLLERLPLTQELTRNLRRMENMLGYLSGENAFSDQRQERVENALAGHRLPPVWRDTLKSLPGYFARAERDPATTLTLVDYLQTLAQDMRGMTLLGDPAERLSRGVRVEDLGSATHDEAVGALADESDAVYLGVGDPGDLTSDELALRVLVTAKFRPTLAPAPSLEAELLRRVEAKGTADPWALLAYGEAFSLSTLELEVREARTRALLVELGGSRGTPDVVEVCAHISLQSWLLANRERPTGGTTAPAEDFQYLANLIRRCRGRVPNGLPSAVALVNSLDSYLGNHLALGMEDEIGPAWWSVPELLPALEETPRPFHEWRDLIAITHMKLIAPRLAAEGAMVRPETPLLLDRALALLRGARQGPRHEYELKMLETLADAVLTLARTVPPSGPLVAPLREFAAASLPDLDHRAKRVQRDLPEALAWGKKTDLVDTTVDSIRDLLNEQEQDR
jgi:serine/threonine protein kinase